MTPAHPVARMLPFAAARAAVDVDIKLGLVKAVGIGMAQDVGRVIYRKGLEEQVEGGAAQGLGFALTEELLLRDGVILNPTFSDHLILTILDMPGVKYAFVEEPGLECHRAPKALENRPRCSRLPPSSQVSETQPRRSSRASRSDRRIL